MNPAKIKHLTLLIFVVLAAKSFAQPASDVEVRIVPAPVPPSSNTLHRNDSHFTSSFNPFSNSFELPLLEWPTQNTFALEVWASDVGAVNSGLVSAYFDITWDNPSIIEPSGIHHSDLFPHFLEGSPNSTDLIVNFGGTSADLVAQGIQPDFALVGWIDFVALDKGLVNFDASVGIGEVGVVGRGLGDLDITGARVTIPEPTSLVLLVCGALVFFPKRQESGSVN